MTQDALVRQWSNALLDRLLAHREEHPEFTFAVRQVNRSQRLDKGYWFQGDESYIFVGFTARGDESNKTRSVGLVFTELDKKQAHGWVEIVFKTEPLKELEYLYRDFLNTDTAYYSNETPYYKDYKYYKDYGVGNPVEILERFLETDWKRLSELVYERKLADTFFVSQKNFILYVNRIQERRNASQLFGQTVNEPTSEYAQMEIHTSEKAQIEIPVLIDDREYPLLLWEDFDKSPGLWQGAVEDYYPAIEVCFTERSGVVTSFQLPEVLAGMRDVLFERINDALRALRESELEGIEPTEESSTDIDRDKILDPYNPDDIKMRTSQFPIFQIFDMIEKKDIDLNPDFQRHLVWDMKRKSRLIESTLLGIPLPVFYFSQDKDGVFHVVDGLQRLTTIRDFMKNKFYLRNLEHLGLCDGRYYKSDENIKENKALERRFQRRMEQTQLHVNIIESSSPPKVKYDIFRRINEGGKPLNQQEIRNSLAKPATRELMKKMVVSSEFIIATGGNTEKGEPGISDQRMGAQEVILRFAGFYLVRKGQITYQGDMTAFLDTTLDHLNALSEKDLNEIGKSFLQGMANCYHLFGQYCFRKCLTRHLRPGAPRQLINKSLFTTWSVVGSTLDPSLVKKLSFESFAVILAQELDKMETYYTVVTLRTNDKSYLEQAFAITENLVTKHIK